VLCFPGNPNGRKMFLTSRLRGNLERRMSIMFIREIFYSLQGEGLNAGMPAVFVRFAGCNLRCQFCDSADAQDVGGEGVSEMSCARVVNTINHIVDQIPMSPPAIVLTGGEPLTQIDAVEELVIALRAAFSIPIHIEVETNGTISIAKHLRLQKGVDQWNVSPKIPCVSGVALKTAYDFNALRILVETGKAWFRFVVRCAEKDLDPAVYAQQFKEMSWILQEAQIPRSRVMLAPMTESTFVLWNPEMPGSNQPQECVSATAVVKYFYANISLSRVAMSMGLRFCPRIHLLCGLR
jgi:7-carboxy-7-deazaguanine synthase